MRKLLTKLVAFQTLTKEEAEEAMMLIGKGEVEPFDIVSFLTIYMMRNVTIEELVGFREALWALSRHVDLSDYEPADIVGTGGDQKNTFNISTSAAFIASGAGVRIAKHGNYGVSSISGSADALEVLGAKFTNDEGKLKESIEKSGMCFLFAPLFHPAMKNVSSIRKAIFQKTIFNILGPLINPSRPKTLVIGVSDLKLHRLYSYVCQRASSYYVILHTLDGYDEVSLTSSCVVATSSREFLLFPSDFGFRTWTQKDIYGGDTKEKAASLLYHLLKGEGEESHIEVALANAAILIQHVKGCKLEDALLEAKESLESKRAFQVLNLFLEVNR